MAACIVLQSIQPRSYDYTVHPGSLAIATYCPYNFSLNSLTLALAAPIHSPTTSIPALPVYPPIPSCLTNLILGSTALVDLDFDCDVGVGSIESSAMVMVVGQSGSSNADGSGKRYLLSERRDGCQCQTQYGKPTLEGDVPLVKYPKRASQRYAPQIVLQISRLGPRTDCLIHILIVRRYRQDRYISHDKHSTKQMSSSSASISLCLDHLTISRDQWSRQGNDRLTIP